MRRRTILIASVTFVLSVGLAGGARIPPAQAIDYGSIGTIGPKNTRIEKDFNPMLGVYPGQQSPRHPFASFRPPACRAVTYCDAFELDVDYPDGYLDNRFAELMLVLTWENPRTEDNPTGNDIDLFVWPDDGPAAGGPVSKCGSPESDECDNMYPEIVRFYDPEPTTDEDDPPIFVTIVNHIGVNTGYKITAEWSEFSIADPPRFVPPKRGTTTERDEVEGPFGFDELDVTESDSGDKSGPRPTPRKIVVPGPDGEPMEIELPVYAAGQRLPATESNGVSPWLPAGVTGALVLGGLSWYLVVRSRRRGQEGV